MALKSKYPWAANPHKEARAIADLRKELDKAPTEAQVRERYESMAGLVIEKEGASNLVGAPEDVAEITVNKEAVKVKPKSKQAKDKDDKNDEG